MSRGVLTELGMTILAFDVLPETYRPNDGPTIVDSHLNRNNLNKCPPKEPPSEGCKLDGREWNREIDWPSKVFVVTGIVKEDKWRGSDGSECKYNDNGDLVPGDVSFNYCPQANSLCHYILDVLPHFIIGGSYR